MSRGIWRTQQPGAVTQEVEAPAVEVTDEVPAPAPVVDVDAKAIDGPPENKAVMMPAQTKRTGRLRNAKHR